MQYAAMMNSSGSAVTFEPEAELIGIWQYMTSPFCLINPGPL